MRAGSPRQNCRKAPLLACHILGCLQASVLRDSSCLDAARLAEMTSEGLQALVGWKRALPLQEERARLLREVSAGVAVIRGRWRSLEGLHVATGCLALLI